MSSGGEWARASKSRQERIKIDKTPSLYKYRTNFTNKRLIALKCNQKHTGTCDCFNILIYMYIRTLVPSDISGH